VFRIQGTGIREQGTGPRSWLALRVLLGRLCGGSSLTAGVVRAASGFFGPLRSLRMTRGMVRGRVEGEILRSFAALRMTNHKVNAQDDRGDGLPGLSLNSGFALALI